MRVPLCFSTISDELSIHFTFIVSNNVCTQSNKTCANAFSPFGFYYLYNSEYMYIAILLIVSMLIGPYVILIV